MTIIQRSLGRLSATTLVALLLTALLAPGCTKERPSVEDPAESPRYSTDDWEGSTYMSLALRTTPPSADPATQPQTEDQSGGNYQVTWQGDDIIDNFAVYIVSEGIDKVQCIAGSVTDKSLATWDADKQELLLKPFRSAPVSKRIFAFFNIPTQYQKYLDDVCNNREAFLKRISEPIPYTGEKGITYDQDAPILDAFRPDSHIATKVVKNEQIGILNSMSKVGRGSDEEKPWFVVDFPDKFFDKGGEREKQGKLDFNKRSDRIFASGEKYNYLPEDNITKEEVENDHRNLVQVYTRRVLAQAVVTVEGSLVEKPNYSGLKGMHIVGLSFQVLNFDPTFYPVAKTTKEGDWPGNGNTVSPLYGKSDNSSRVNLSNYLWSYSDETFDLESLIVDRYFRSAHFVYDHPSIKELKQDDPLYAQKLMREREISTDKKIDGFDPIGGKTAPDSPKHTTTFWGSCYVTESTQKWGTDSSSGYTTSNTPFFAIVASFDTESLPWGDNTIATAKAKINNKQKDHDDAVKKWRDELAAKEKELADLPEGGGSGKKEEEEANAAYKKWYDYIVECVGEGRANSGTFTKNFKKIIANRDNFKSGTITEEDYIKTWTPKSSPRNKIRRDLPKEYQKTQEDKYWKDTFDKDKVYLKAKNDPYAEKRQQLTNEIAVLKKDIEDFEKEFKSSGKKYPKKEHSEDNLEFFTQFIYEQGVTRIFYSQVDGKFYLNYHEIPLSSRRNLRHTLTVNDEWLKDLKSKLPNGKDFPTKANGASKTNAVLPPSAELMGRLSQLLNGEIKETDLSPEERRSMDFYLYGRVAPGLVQYFGGAKRIDRIDLQGGYVAWYSANKNNKDQVVSYPCYVRNKQVDLKGKEVLNSISKARLMMVYYAWLNPNTKDPSTSFASPVLRNNIYHMHITGFTKMGLSAIPFVPNIKEGKGYKFLHAPLDPDETVPGPGAPLSEAKGSAGQATGLSTARSASYSITF